MRNGQFLWRKMRQELISMEELLSQLRRQGVTGVKGGKVAYIESDGGLSVIRSDGKGPSSQQHKSATLG